MSIDLEARITVQEGTPLIGKPIWVKFTVTNQTASSVSLINPDVGTPSIEINWAFSNETYQISTLLSFHMMAISMVDPSGKELPMVGPNPWVTPILMPRLEFALGDFFTLQINLTNHFELHQTGRYHLTVEYGDENAFARAESELLLE